MPAAGFTAVGEFHYLGARRLRPPRPTRPRGQGIAFVCLHVAYARGGLERMRQAVRCCLSQPTSRVSESGESRSDITPHSVRACPRYWLVELGRYAAAEGLVLHVHADEQPRCVLIEVHVVLRQSRVPALRAGLQRALQHVPFDQRALNFKAGEFDEKLVAPGRTGLPWDLTENAYFARLTDAGYAIRVYQPDYLNFCANPGPTTSCYTYAATSLGALAPVSLPGVQKAPIIASMYLDRSNTYAFVRQLYNSCRSPLRARGLRVPPWNWERNRLSPFSTMAALRGSRRTSRGPSAARPSSHTCCSRIIRTCTTGTCGVRPPREWLERKDHADAPAGSVNSAAGRELRYGQVRGPGRVCPAPTRPADSGDSCDAAARRDRRHSGRSRLSHSQDGAEREYPALACGLYRQLFHSVCRQVAVAAGRVRPADGLSHLPDARSGPERFPLRRRIGRLQRQSPVFVSDERRVARPLPPFGEPPHDTSRLVSVPVAGETQ